MTNVSLYKINRILWGIIFSAGAIIFAFIEWQGKSSSAMFWFLVTSFWSAFCGISYTIVDWFLSGNSKNNLN